MCCNQIIGHFAGMLTRKPQLPDTDPMSAQPADFALSLRCMLMTSGRVPAEHQTARHAPFSASATGH
jgi:hypothetical protein